MGLREKFLPATPGLTPEAAQILVCTTNYHLLVAEDLLRQAGIPRELIPTPRGIGSACTTALRFPRAARARVDALLAAHGVEVQGIYDPVRRNRLEEWREVFTPALGEEYARVLRKVACDETITASEIETLLATTNPEEEAALLRAADLMRAECVGEVVDIRAAIEFSNYCRKNCYYCGLRRGNTALRRYRMTEEEILAVARRLHAMGLRTLILQSGEDAAYTVPRLAALVRAIKKELGMRVTLSVGELRREDYQTLKEAGTDNYLLKLETANPELFRRVHPDDDYEERLTCIRTLKDLGYITGSGNIVGLPGQTTADLAADILSWQRYGIHMLGIGPFLPAANTPYAQEPPGDLRLTLRVVAAARLICQNVYIPATTAMASLAPGAQAEALRAGANVIMLIMTPPAYREAYQPYSHKVMVDLDYALASVRQAGRRPPAYLRGEVSGAIIKTDREDGVGDSVVG